MSDFYDALESRSPEQRQNELMAALQQQVANAKDNAPAYQNILAEIDPSSITSPESFAKLPLTRKSELIELQKQSRPFGGFVTKNAQLNYVFASPGPIYEPGSQRKDNYRMARALYAAGIRQDDLVKNCYSYHLTPAGMMFDSGAHAIGCPVIPAGTGQTDIQLEIIADLKPTAYVGTPSFLKIILEKGEAKDVDVSSIKKALVSGEALPPSIRAGFEERGITTKQCYATADIGLIAYETEADQGMVIDENIYLEIVRPGTGDPVADGEVGEIVVTSFNPDYPLIRFATGDLSMILTEPSPCGRSNKRIQGWMGRADQTTKVRGMFIHPEQIDAIVKKHPEISKARLIVDWQNESDQMTLHCETAQANDDLNAAICQSIREICKVRGDVQLVAEGNLTNDGKVIDDIRQYD